MSEQTVSAKAAFRGRLLRVEVRRVRLSDGRHATREVVCHPGAVAVLARDARGRFLLVRQYRNPVARNLLEVVAGTREPGESPRACAIRELREETGYVATRIRKLGVIYLAPGYSTEALHVYYADAVNRGAQQPDADEHVSVVRISRRMLELAMARGRVRDSKTLAAWLLFRLRGGRP